MKNELIASFHRRHRFATPMDLAYGSLASAMFLLAAFQLLTPFVR